MSAWLTFAPQSCALPVLDKRSDVIGIRTQLATTLAHFIVLLNEKLGKLYLRDNMALIIENVQKHPTTPFIEPLPIPATPIRFTAADTPTPEDHHPDHPPTSTSPRRGRSVRWADNDETLNERIDNYLDTIKEPDLGQFLADELNTLHAHADGIGNDVRMQLDPYRQCAECTSPLRINQAGPFCIACVQSPDAKWPGTPVIASKDSSPYTYQSSCGVLSGQNSLSTSMTSQDSMLDNAMSAYKRRVLRNANTVYDPLPVSRPLAAPAQDDEYEEIFDVEDLDFEGEDVLANLEHENLMDGWSLYWDDSCDERSDWEDRVGV